MERAEKVGAESGSDGEIKMTLSWVEIAKLPLQGAVINSPLLWGPLEYKRSI